MPTTADPYLDPETGILRNLVGARTQADLTNAEADLSAHRLWELARGYPLRPTGDLAELRAIHRHLFQDIYDWAGELRTVDIRKPGGEPFLPVSRLDTGLRFAFDELAGDNHLQGFHREAFTERLAHHYDQLNFAHPFREGNGRTQRVFWSRVAHDAAWGLDWSRVTGARNDEVSRTAREQFNLKPLREMFAAIATPSAPQGAGRAKLNIERLTPSAGEPAAEQRAAVPAPGQRPGRRYTR